MSDKDNEVIRKYSNAQMPITPIEKDFSKSNTQIDERDYNFNKENTRQNDIKIYYQTKNQFLQEFIKMQHQSINRKDQIINFCCFIYGLSFVVTLFIIYFFVT